MLLDALYYFNIQLISLLVIAAGTKERKFFDFDKDGNGHFELLPQIFKFLYQNERLCGDVFAEPQWLPAQQNCRILCPVTKGLCLVYVNVSANGARVHKQKCRHLPTNCTSKLQQMLFGSLFNGTTTSDDGVNYHGNNNSNNNYMTSDNNNNNNASHSSGNKRNNNINNDNNNSTDNGSSGVNNVIYATTNNNNNNSINSSSIWSYGGLVNVKKDPKNRSHYGNTVKEGGKYHAVKTWKEHGGNLIQQRINAARKLCAHNGLNSKEARSNGNNTDPKYQHSKNLPLNVTIPAGDFNQLIKLENNFTETNHEKDSTCDTVESIEQSYVQEEKIKTDKESKNFTYSLEHINMLLNENLTGEVWLNKQAKDIKNTTIISKIILESNQMDFNDSHKTADDMENKPVFDLKTPEIFNLKQMENDIFVKNLNQRIHSKKKKISNLKEPQISHNVEEILHFKNYTTTKDIEENSSTNPVLSRISQYNIFEIVGDYTHTEPRNWSVEGSMEKMRRNPLKYIPTSKNPLQRSQKDHLNTATYQPALRMQIAVRNIPPDPKTMQMRRAINHHVKENPGKLDHQFSDSISEILQGKKVYIVAPHQIQTALWTASAPSATPSSTPNFQIMDSKSSEIIAEANDSPDFFDESRIGNDELHKDQVYQAEDIDTSMKFEEIFASTESNIFMNKKFYDMINLKSDITLLANEEGELATATTAAFTAPTQPNIINTPIQTTVNIDDNDDTNSDNNDHSPVILMPNQDYLLVPKELFTYLRTVASTAQINDGNNGAKMLPNLTAVPVVPLLVPSADTPNFHNMLQIGTYGTSKVSSIVSLDQNGLCCKWALEGMCDRSWQRIRQLCKTSCGPLICSTVEAMQSCSRLLNIDITKCYQHVNNFDRAKAAKSAESKKKVLNKRQTLDNSDAATFTIRPQKSL